MNRTKLISIAFAALAGSAWGQAPRIANAQLQTRSAASGLEPMIQSIVTGASGPVWIGYAVPVQNAHGSMCCFNDGGWGCSLEPGHGGNISVVQGNRTVQLEGATRMFVLLRVENKNVGKVRSFTPDCDIDAGGLPFYWLEGARPSDSVHYLTALAKSGADSRDEERRSEGAVTAIAMHADASADAALDEFAAAGQPERLRRKAIFWLGNARGRHGYETVSRILREDANDKVREHAIFALTQSKEPQAMDAVIRAAHDDKIARVRGQALFWLAQKAGHKAAASAISDAIANDPETQVKKKAVFALTQMPESEGVPLLIEAARANRNPEVRKQAMFWLGQSKDPRALKFIEEVLTR
jgi:hypothetical protein